jgi:hypothetical protein
MLRVKQQFLGTKLMKSNEHFVLSNDLTQNQLKYISLFVSEKYVEEFHQCDDKCIQPCPEKQTEEYMSTGFFRKKKKND